jgi:hypothetical protein
LFISSLPTRLSFQESFNVMSKPADFKKWLIKVHAYVI